MPVLTVEDALQEIRKIVGPYPQIIVDIRDCGQETLGSYGRIEYCAQIGVNGEQYTARTMAAVLDQIRKALTEKPEVAEESCCISALLHSRERAAKRKPE